MTSYERDVRLRARELTGTTWELAEQIIMWLSQYQSPKVVLEICALRHRLADVFAAYHGWKLSPSPFSIEVLAQRGVWGAGEYGGYSHVDHPYFFRTSNKRAAGLAVHLYGGIGPHRQEEIHRWAKTHNLRADFPADYPSWWVPDATSLCLYRPSTAVPESEAA